MRQPNYYCSASVCRRSTRRLAVRLDDRTYLYCVKCGRRLEVRDPRGAGEFPRRRSA